jgi:hypothetical protein
MRLLAVFLFRVSGKSVHPPRGEAHLGNLPYGEANFTSSKPHIQLQSKGGK